MSTESDGTEMPEMRGDLEPVQGDIAEGVPEVQVPFLVQEAEGRTMKYKIRMFSEYDELYLEHFTDYNEAYNQFVALSEDREFINYYQKQVTLSLAEGYVGKETIHWEVIQKSTLFPDGPANTENTEEISD